jgi:hypothetical protein
VADEKRHDVEPIKNVRKRGWNAVAVIDNADFRQNRASPAPLPRKQVRTW